MSDWMQQAACRGMDPAIWHPTALDTRASSVRRQHPERIDAICAPAKAICRRCPVVADCLAYAIDNAENDGVWGGMDPQERQRLVGVRRRCKWCGRGFSLPRDRQSSMVTCGAECQRLLRRSQTWTSSDAPSAFSPDPYRPGPVDWSENPNRDVDDPRSRAADAAGTDSYILGRVG